MSAAKVRTAAPGRYCDGGATGLYLLVRDAEHKFWIFRYSINGKTREAGLGAAVGPSSVTLAKARDKARDMYEVVSDGRDPLLERDASRALQRAAAEKAAAGAVTFEMAAERYIAANKAGWRNEKHGAQWNATLAKYAYPTIGKLPVAEVTTEHVLGILDPIWSVKSETASRVRGRIESVLDYAKVRTWRDGENPARWRGHLASILPSRGKVAPVKHHAALPFQDARSFMTTLRQQRGVSARALQFLVLTAARSGEARGARWNEIDLEARTWTVPPDRMKGGREHLVPLSPGAVAVLHEVEPLRQSADDLVFPGGRTGQPLSDVAIAKAARAAGSLNITTHGFRSTFRDWVSECTSFPPDVAEMALAHSVRDKTEAAYRRGKLLAKRRDLMVSWDRYCRGGS